MATIELPSWADGSWDILEIEGLEVPGLVRVEVSRGPKWDRKEAAGQTGEKVTFKGFRGADVTLKVRLWTSSQEAAFETSVLPVIDAQPGKEQPKALSVAHPGLVKRKVEAIYVEDVDGPTIDDDAQFSEYEIKAFEHRKPVPQQGPPGGPGQTPCQQAKADYDYWTKQARIYGDKGISDFDSLEAYQQAQNYYEIALRNAQIASLKMAQLGCSEASPGSNAQAGAAGGGGGGNAGGDALAGSAGGTGGGLPPP